MNSLEDFELHLCHQPKPKPKLCCVGRLSHERYMHNGKLVSKSVFSLLKRKSDLSLSDLVFDADIEIDNLELGNHAEGLYEIILCNPSRDWETGIIDGWELKLVPYKEEE